MYLYVEKEQASNKGNGVQNASLFRISSISKVKKYCYNKESISKCGIFSYHGAIVRRSKPEGEVIKYFD